MDWPRWVFVGATWCWRLAGVACLAAAAVPRRSPDRRAALALFGVVLPLLGAALELAQYGAYQLMWDSGVFSNLVWNVAHGAGMRSDVLGPGSYFGVHFTLIPYLLAPLGLLPRSIAALAVVQGACVGSTILAAFLLTESLTPDRRAPWLVAALAASCVLYRLLIAQVLDGSVYAPAFFVWAAYFFERRRYAAAALFAALLLATREHAPLIALGFGLFIAASRRGRARTLGAALALAAAGLWLAEIRVVRAEQVAWANPYQRWDLFSALGGSPEAVRALALRRPWVLVAALVWPPAKLWTPVRTFASFALLPLFSGWGLLPALAAWLPNQLADVDCGFQRLGWHYGSFVLGPLIYAAALGVARLRKAPRWAEALAFALAAGQFFWYAPFEHAGIVPSRWKESVPKALAAIPPDSSVWVDEYLLPQLSMRRHVKSLQPAIPPRLLASFAREPFSPDRVLLSAYWARRAEPPSRDAVLGFLKDEKYRAIFEDGDLIVLARPAEGSAREVVHPH